MGYISSKSIVIPNTHWHGRDLDRLDRVIIHSIGEYVRVSGHAQHCVTYLNSVGLSTHTFVPPHGDTVIETVMWEHMAQHAKLFNLTSYGVEFMVEGLHDNASREAACKEPWLRRSAFDAAWKHVGRLMATVGRELEITTHDRVDPERRPIDPGPMFSFDEFVTKAGKEYESYVTGRQQV